MKWRYLWYKENLTEDEKALKEFIDKISSVWIYDVQGRPDTKLHYLHSIDPSIVGSPKGARCYSKDIDALIERLGVVQ